jgi:hypothetical protein
MERPYILRGSISLQMTLVNWGYKKFSVEILKRHAIPVRGDASLNTSLKYTGIGTFATPPQGTERHFTLPVEALYLSRQYSWTECQTTKNPKQVNYLGLDMADRTGLEPATSGVTVLV